MVLALDCVAWPFDALFWPYILHWVIDTFDRFEANRAAALAALLWPIVAGIALVVYMEVISRIMGFAMAKALPRLQATLRMRMFDHIQHHSPRYFNERFSGTLANKVTDMTTQVESLLVQLWWPIVPAVASCLLGSRLFLWFDPCDLCLDPARLDCGPPLGLHQVHEAVSGLYEHRHGEARSTLLGKIVDSLTNNFAVNQFYRFKQEKQHPSALSKRRSCRPTSSPSSTSKRCAASCRPSILWGRFWA